MKTSVKRNLEIIQAFRGVLESGQKQYSIGLPDSLLPFPEAEIKNAIKEHARYLSEKKQLSEKAIQDLRMLFVSLGLFVSGADAETVKAFRNAANSDEHTGDAGKSRQFQFITNKVRARETHNLQEFKLFYSRIGKGNPNQDEDLD